MSTDVAPARRQRVGDMALGIALAFTAVWAAVLSLRVLGGLTLRGRVADVGQAVIGIGYLAAVPIACFVAFKFGARSRNRSLVVGALSVAWLAFVVWSSTLTF